MKLKKYVLSIICLIALSFVFVSSIKADVGNSFSGDSSGDSSSSSSWDDDYGDDYDSSGGITITGPLAWVIIGGPLVAFGAAFIYFMKFAPKNVGRKLNEEEAVAQIKVVDPDFSADKFKTFAGEVYITLQEAWEAKDWKGVRPIESNALFNTHNRQIQEYIDANKTDHMDKQNIREITIAEFKEDENQEVLVVKLYASLLNYVTDDNTGNIIEGSDKDYVHRNYCLEFIRSKGVKTVIDKEMSVTNCPNCGAPTTVSSSGECEYCHSIITSGNYGWVLNKYSKW